MKRFLSHINWILGSLSLLLAGCSSQKHAQKNHDVMVLYGVGLEDYAPLPNDVVSESERLTQPTDSTGSNAKDTTPTNTDTTNTDTTSTPDETPSRTIALPTDSLDRGLPPRDGRPSIMVKYGVMPPKQPSSN